MRRSIVLVLGLLLVGVAVWLLAASFEAPDGAQGRSPVPEEEGALVHLDGRARPSEDAGDLAVPTAQGPEHGEGPQGQRVRLRGTMRMADGSPLPERLLLEVGPSTWISGDAKGLFTTGTVRGDGSFEIDVTEVLRAMEGRSEARELHLWSNHARCLRVRHPVPIPHRQALLAGESTLDEVELVLQPAAWIEGRVLEADGAPRGAYKIHAWRALDGTFSDRHVERVWPNEDGRYRLRVGPAGRFLVVAEWTNPTPHHTSHPRMKPLRRPGFLWVEVEPGRAVRAADITLPPSLEITGVVRSGTDPVPWPDLAWQLPRVEATLRDDGEWPTLVLVDGVVCYGRGTVDGDANGAFQITGLSPRAYEIHVKDARDVLVHPVVMRERAPRVTPPKHGLDLQLPLAHLLLCVEVGGSAQAWAYTRVAAVGGRPDLPTTVSWNASVKGTDADGHVALRVTPHASYAVEVEADGYAPHREVVTAPPPGETLEIPIALERETVSRRLEVRFAGEDLESVGLASFGLARHEGGPRPDRPRDVRTARVTDGRAVLEQVEPGRYVVWVRPGSRWTGTPSVWVGETIEVQVPGEPALVTLRRGGALHLIVTDGDGAFLEATCDVTGPGGAQVETQLEYDPGLGRTWVQPVLPPGGYVLTIHAEGHRRVVRHVAIEAGRPTQVQLALD